MNDERSRIRQLLEELSARRAIAAKLLKWLESDSSFEATYGSAALDRNLTQERERIARLDRQIAGYRDWLETD